MTNPVAPPDVLQASPWPALGSANYNQEAYAAGSTQPAAFARQGEIAVATHTNAVSANESAAAALQSSLDAANAAAPALAAANFKGLWPSLTGPLNKPASVKHEGRFWLLLNNLPNVASSEPGETADWTSLEAGEVVQVVTANTPMTPGVTHVVAVAGITLQAPAVLAAGDKLIAKSIVNAPYLANWNGHSVKGDPQSVPMSIPALMGFELSYTGSTLA